jgi:hypothetical protein
MAAQPAPSGASSGGGGGADAATIFVGSSVDWGVDDGSKPAAAPALPADVGTPARIGVVAAARDSSAVLESRSGGEIGTVHDGSGCRTDGGGDAGAVDDPGADRDAIPSSHAEHVFAMMVNLMESLTEAERADVMVRLNCMFRSRNRTTI